MSGRWPGLRFALVLAGGLGLAAPVPAEETPAELFAKPAAAQEPPEDAAPCSDPGYRQFDFWIGDWVVDDAAGERLGENRVEAVLGGCALVERWSGAQGSAGMSINQYDSRDGRWHQVWVDARGGRLELTGTRRGESMTLAGRTTNAGGRVYHEISWTRLEDGRVRQHWRSSPDGGASWEDVFVGLYTRRGPAPAPIR